MSDKRILEFETATEAGDADFVAIDSLAGGTRKIPVTDLPGGGGGGGTTVVPNPVGEPTEELETIKIGSIIYDIPGSGGSGGSGFQITKLWNYADDNAGTIPYRTYSPLTLNDNLSNYDGVFLELVSDIQDLSDWQATCLTQIWPIEALTDAYFPMNVGYTSYGGRSSHYVFTDTTIACTQSDSNMVNGLVNVYGVKFGGGSNSASEIIEITAGDDTTTRTFTFAKQPQFIKFYWGDPVITGGWASDAEIVWGQAYMNYRSKPMGATISQVDGGINTISYGADGKSLTITGGNAFGAMNTSNGSGLMFIDYGASGGSDVEANPQETPTDTLETIKIGDTVYDIMGSDGASTMESVLSSPVQIGSNTDITVSDISDADMLIFDFGILTGDNKKVHLIAETTLEALDDTTGYKFVGSFVSTYDISFGISKTNNTTLHIADFYKNGWQDQAYMWNIYKVKLGSAGGPAYEETDLFTNTGSTNPSSISLADDIRNYDEIAFYVDRTSYGGYKVQFRYTTSGITLNDRILLPLWSTDNEYISYTVSDWDELGNMAQGNALILTKIVGIKHKNGRDYHVYDQHEKIVGEWFGEPLYEKTVVIKENGIDNYTYSSEIYQNCLPVSDFINITQMYAARGDTVGYVDVVSNQNEVYYVPNKNGDLFFRSSHSPTDIIVTVQYTKSTS